MIKGKEIDQIRVDQLTRYKYKLDKVHSSQKALFLDVLFGRVYLSKENSKKAQEIFISMEEDIKTLMKDAEAECIELCGNMIGGKK